MWYWPWAADFRVKFHFSLREFWKGSHFCWNRPFPTYSNILNIPDPLIVPTFVGPLLNHSWVLHRINQKLSNQLSSVTTSIKVYSCHVMSITRNSPFIRFSTSRASHQINQKLGNKLSLITTSIYSYNSFVKNVAELSFYTHNIWLDRAAMSTVFN